jgi:hypothetical protein
MSAAPIVLGWEPVIGGLDIRRKLVRATVTVTRPRLDERTLARVDSPRGAPDA